MAATTFLVTLGEFSLSEIGEARLELELICCRLAATRRRDEHLKAMAEEIRRQKSGQLTGEEFCASDVRFHHTLVDATGNSILQFVMSTVMEALQPISNMVIFRFSDRKKIVAQHEKIYEAIRLQDLKLAEEAIQEQMDYLHAKHVEAQEWRRRQDELKTSSSAKTRQRKKQLASS
jgi:DNA-binding FadR family transcriptional regulator